MPAPHDECSRRIFVVLGPLPSSSVLASMNYAEAIVHCFATRGHLLPIPPMGTLLRLRDYLRTWHMTALVDEVFLWSDNVDAADAAVWMQHLYTVACALDDPVPGGELPAAPAAGAPFYRAVIVAVLDALAGAGGEFAMVAAELRKQWPGLTRPGS